MKQLATQTGCETCSSHFAQFWVKSCLLSQEQRSALLSSPWQKAMNRDRPPVQIGSAWHTMLDIIFCRNLKFYRWWDFLSFNILLNWPKGIEIPLTELMRWKEWLNSLTLKKECWILESRAHQTLHYLWLKENPFSSQNICSDVSWYKNI